MRTVDLFTALKLDSICDRLLCMDQPDERYVSLWTDDSSDSPQQDNVIFREAGYHKVSDESSSNDHEVNTSPDCDAFIDAQIDEVIKSERITNNCLSREDELNLAVEFCKKHLQDAEADEQQAIFRKKLVEKIIDCRLQLQELKENSGVCDDDKGPRRTELNVLGHEFIIQSSSGRNPYCEVCITTIWRIVQRWRRCKVCGLRAHEKCIDNVKRKCVGIDAASPNFRICSEICEEQSLEMQQFRCAECEHPICFGSSPECEPRLCDYNGRYYCPRCHWNDEMVIPARVIHNWDHRKYGVCRASKQLLCIVDRKPLINMMKLNPKLVTYVSELKRIDKLRRDIIFMKCYFVCCKDARKLRILQYLNQRQHFVDSPDWYSLTDLKDLAQGTLLPEIEQICAVFVEHITKDCEICKGKGFICELCSQEEAEIIYPFSDGVSICQACCAVFHQKCFARVSRNCPRCKRRHSRAPLQLDGESGGISPLCSTVMSVDSVPRDLRNLRACLLCSLIKTVEQFEMDGCDNCDRFLGMKGDEEKVGECTSSNFDGMIAATMPDDSWVCKWQKINRKVKGIYAVSVSGSLPAHIIQELKAQNIRYKPNMRDMTVNS